MKLITPYVVTEAEIIGTTVRTVNAYDAGTTYNTGDEAQVASTKAAYQSLIDSNLGNTPPVDGEGKPTSDANWLYVGVANQLRAFDEKLGQRVEKDITTTPLRYTLLIPQDVDAVAFVGVKAKTARVAVLSSLSPDVIVSDRTVNVTYPTTYAAGFDYSTLSAYKTANVVFEGVAAPVGTYIRVDLDADAGTVSVGQIVLGATTDLGGANEDGVSIKIVDYSTNEVDEFGGRTIVLRDFATTAELELMTDPGREVEVASALAAVRASAGVYYETEAMVPGRGLFVYGYPSDVSIEPGHGYTSVSLTITSLAAGAVT